MNRHDCEYKNNLAPGECDICAEIAEEKLNSLDDMYHAIKAIVRSFHSKENDLQYLIDEIERIKP